MTVERRYIKDKVAEIKSFAQKTNVNVGEDQFDRLYEFLVVAHDTSKLRPFTTQVAVDRVGVKWTVSEGSVVVWFGPNEDWSWGARTAERTLSTNNEDSDDSFEVTYHHSGKCSYRINGDPRYLLPSEVEELISEPDTFEGTYAPILKPYDYEIVWVTNKYDGMLSGYVRFNEKLHYFNLIEETEFSRRRMFAVYELSAFERLNAWRRYHWWHAVIANSLLWKYHWWFDGMKNRRSAEELEQAKNKFKDEHVVVGYFEG